MISGFGGSGSPSNLTVINNNAGNCKIGLAVMIYAGMVTKNDLLFPKILQIPKPLLKNILREKSIGTGSTRHLGRVDPRGLCGHVWRPDFPGAPPWN